METTKLPPSSPSSPTTSFSVPSAEKVDGFPRRSMRRARQRRSHSSSQFRYQSSQVELTPLPLLKGEALIPPKQPQINVRNNSWNMWHWESCDSKRSQSTLCVCLHCSPTWLKHNTHTYPLTGFHLNMLSSQSLSGLTGGGDGGGFGLFNRSAACLLLDM